MHSWLAEGEAIAPTMSMFSRLREEGECGEDKGDLFFLRVVLLLGRDDGDNGVASLVHGEPPRFITPVTGFEATDDSDAGDEGLEGSDDDMIEEL